MAGNGMDNQTSFAGIDIRSTNPVFLAVVAIHVLLGLACVITGAIAMLSQKRAGSHPRYGTVYFSCLAAVFVSASGLAAVRWRRITICSFWACCRLQRPLWAVRPDGIVGASGSGCTSPGWDRPTSCS